MSDGSGCGSRGEGVGSVNGNGYHWENTANLYGLVSETIWSQKKM